MNSREPIYAAVGYGLDGARDCSRHRNSQRTFASRPAWTRALWACLAVMALLLCSGMPQLANASGGGLVSRPRPIAQTRAGLSQTTARGGFDVGVGLRLAGPAGGPAIAQPAPDPTATPDDDGPAASDPQARIVEREELKQKARLGSTLLEKKSVPPFWVHRKFDTHTTKALTLPPLFLHRTPTPDGEAPQKFLHMDLSLTFGWYDQRKSKRRWVNPVGLYFGAFDEHQASWAAVPLLMGYKRIGEKYNFGQFPLVWAWGNRYSKNLLIVPFHFQNKTPESFQGVSSLLFWYGYKNRGDANPANDRKHFIAFPLYWDLTRGAKRVRVAPLFVGGSNTDKGLKHRTLFPLFHWQSRENGNHKELWTPLFVRRKDGYRNVSDWALPPLLSFSTKHGDQRVASYTPLVWRASNAARRSKAWAVGPAGWYRSESQRAQWMAPLYLHFSDEKTGAKAGMFLPFAGWQRNETQTRVHTVLGYGRKSVDGFGFGIHPLLTYVGKRGGKAHSVVAGGTLWWQFVDTRKGTEGWGVGPLAYRTKGHDRRRFGMPALMTFTGRTGPRSYQVVTPLFVHAKNKAGPRAHDTYVVGPAYFSKRTRGNAAGLAPIFFFAGGAEGYGVVPPLLAWWNKDTARGRFRFASLPFVYDRDPTGRTVGVLGLAWDAKHTVKGEGGPQLQRDSVLAPLYYRRERGEKSFWVSPIGGGVKGPERGGWAAGPVYGWQRGARDGAVARKGFGVAPLFFHTKREGQGATSVIPGLFIRDRRPERDLDMWTPLLWRSEVRGDKARKGFALVPLYFRQRQPGGYDIDAGLGFFWGRNRTRHTHTLIAGPFFHHKTRKALHTGLAPFSYWMDSVEKRRLIALPLIVHDEDKLTGRSTTLALPFWVDRKLPNGRRTWMAFPFVFGREYAFDFTRASIAPPGYFDILRLRQNYRFTGTPFLFRYQKCGFQQGDDDACRYTLWGSFPLFFVGKDGKGRRTHSVLGLYWADKDPGGKKFYTLLGGYQYRPNERTRWYAGPLYRDVTKTHATTAFFPLFFHRKHRTMDRGLTLVAPPLFIQQRRDDRRWFEAGLLVWQFRSPAKVTTVVAPPIFGMQHTYKERKLSWLAPLYVDDNSFGNDERWTSVLPGLYVQHRKGDRKQIIQVPFVWHFAQRDRHTTVGVPLWYDFRRNDKRTRVVPALYFGREQGPEKAREKLRVIGPGLAWWRTSPGSRHWSALLGLFGGGHEGEQRYMHLFGRRIKLKGKAKVDASPEAKPDAGDATAPQAKRSKKESRRARRQARRGHPRRRAAAM